MPNKVQNRFYSKWWFYLALALLYFLLFCVTAPHFATWQVRILFWGVFLPGEGVILTGAVLVSLPERDEHE